MTLTVHLFAAVRDRARADALAVELPAGATVGDLRAALAAQLPDAADLLRRSAVAVNQDFAPDTQLLVANDEIAVIPPVSGG